ncbi:MAG: hypothetical protein ACJ763_11095 [Bdellovibrionia bacterium]
MNQGLQVRVQKLFSLGLLSLSLLSLSGCELVSKSTAAPAAALQNGGLTSELRIVLDPDLSKDERTSVISDLNRAQVLDVHGKPGSYFAKIFGTPDNSGVMRYLSERVHYILPRAIKLDSRLSHSTFRVYTFALNVGTMLWFEALGNPKKPSYLRVGQSLIPIQSSRVGIIQLGEGYTLKDASPTLTSPILRIATLIHEARHSDCTGGMNSSDLEKLLMGDDPDKSTCGHLHVRCPEGHKYDGAYACDDEAWGAYSVEATYLTGIIKDCPNCTAEEKTIATTLFADCMDRVIPAKDMLAGKLGDPDMSSSTEVHQSPETDSPFGVNTLHSLNILR